MEVVSQPRGEISDAGDCIWAGMQERNRSKPAEAGPSQANERPDDRLGRFFEVWFTFRKLGVNFCH